MSNVIDISTKFKKVPPAPSVQEIAEFAVEEISGNWERFATNNKLNEYFVQCVPTWSKPDVDYLSDLSALSSIEQKIRLEVQVISPGFNIDNALGWIAAFRINGIVMATPFMMSEAYARCFNILLYLKIKRDMVTNKIPVTT